MFSTRNANPKLLSKIWIKYFVAPYHKKIEQKNMIFLLKKIILKIFQKIKMLIK